MNEIAATSGNQKRINWATTIWMVVFQAQAQGSSPTLNENSRATYKRS
jgi:hypothetical protein